MNEKKRDKIIYLFAILVIALAVITLIYFLTGCTTFNVQGDLLMDKQQGVKEIKVDVQTGKKVKQDTDTNTQKTEKEKLLSEEMKAAFDQVLKLKKMSKNIYFRGVSWQYFKKIARIIYNIEIEQSNLEKK